MWYIHVYVLGAYICTNTCLNIFHVYKSFTNPLKRKVASQFLNVLAQFLTHYQHFCKKKKWCGTQKWGGRGRETTLFFYAAYHCFCKSIWTSKNEVLLLLTSNLVKDVSRYWFWQHVIIEGFECCYISVISVGGLETDFAWSWSWTQMSMTRSWALVTQGLGMRPSRNWQMWPISRKWNISVNL